MEGEKQARVGNLDKMTLQQLRELLDRQEKLLSRQRFLHTLPDGGQKVKNFAARLQQLISQRQTESDIHAASQRHPSARQKQSENRRTPSPASSVLSVTDPDSLAPESETVAPGNGDTTDGTAALSDAIDSMVISELAAPRMTNKLSSEKTESREDLEVRFQNSYENIMKNQTAGSKKAPFKPNSSLKISDLHQLPDKYKCRSRPSTGGDSASRPPAPQAPDSSTTGSGKAAGKVQEESAVVGPAYRFEGAKEIGLQESIRLQRQQQENLEKIQTLHAAERLAERLNIKTVDYNPSSLDMQYRSKALEEEDGDYDSDDNTYDDDVPD
ncbi:DNA-directed RNA polymerase II subunit GRINL1A-like [Babylonia areolata]|uniref:DNA-directed RNA polymerase II subunit GRINL1A-like n=1 Tax=Babylonia areolata TaxID=304850 RepID=UPI003FCFE981